MIPQNITAGKWTISAPSVVDRAKKQYVTFHNLSVENGFAKVFSLSSEDTHVLNSDKVPGDGLNEAPSEEQKNERKKSEVERQSEQKAGDSAITSAVGEKDSTAPTTTSQIDISGIKEEDLYEKVNLYGTLVKVIKYPRSNTMADLTSHNTYLIYDQSHRKFYLMMLASNNRYIAVAEDLNEMSSLLKEHAAKKCQHSEESSLMT